LIESLATQGGGGRPESVRTEVKRVENKTKKGGARK